MKPSRMTIAKMCAWPLLAAGCTLITLVSVTNLSAQTVPDISKMLENAKSRHVNAPRDEKSKVHSDDSTKWYMNHCNKNDYDDGSWDTASTCEDVARTYLQIVGPGSQTAEAALQRGCAYPVHSRYVSPCAELGDLYAQRGDNLTALAVYLQAPNCTQGFGNVEVHSRCLRSAAQIYRKLADVPRERATVQFICATYYWHESCVRFQQLGGSVNLNVTDQKFDEVRDQEREAVKEMVRQDAEDRAERHAESEARFNALMGALQSMPGASDPNAVLNAGNQQAAAIRAVGDANAAQKRAAAEFAAEQAKQARDAAEQARLAANQAASSSGGSNLLRTGNSSEIAGSASSGQVAEGYIAPIAQNCVGTFWDPKFYNWLSFQNDCGQAIHLTWIAQSPHDHFGAASADMAAGQSTNTGWNKDEVTAKGNFALFICPAGSLAVDNSTGVPVRYPTESFSCKKQ
jgi:hypothetical protein